MREGLEITRRGGEVDILFSGEREVIRTKRRRTRAVRHVREGLEYSILKRRGCEKRGVRENPSKT